ncbi:12942_t:CDS:2, partial [Cetraspora pellucida]
MRQNLATKESLGFKYLILFKEKYREEAAEELEANPTVHDVVNVAVQAKEWLETYQVKATRIDLNDGTGTVDLEFHQEESNKSFWKTKFDSFEVLSAWNKLPIIKPRRKSNSYRIVEIDATLFLE